MGITFSSLDRVEPRSLIKYFFHHSVKEAGGGAGLGVSGGDVLAQIFFPWEKRAQTS